MKNESHTESPGSPLRVLLLEDNPDDAELVLRELRRAGLAAAVKQVQARDEFVRALAEFGPDVVISDYRLPEFDGRAALEIVRASHPDLPLIIVSGTLGDEQAAELIRLGAADFLLKDRLARLGAAVTAAVERAAESRCRRSQEIRFRALIENVSDVVTVIGADGTVTYASPSVREATGYDPQEIVGTNFLALIHPDDQVRAAGDMQQILREPGLVQRLERRYRDKSGAWRVAEQVACNRISNPAVRGIVVVLRDITERRRAEAELQLQGAALTASANAIVITNREGAIQWINPAFTAMTGFPADEALGRNLRELVKSGQQEPELYREMWDTILAGRVWRGELVNRRKDGSLYHEEQTITPVHAASGEITHFVAIKQDLTARKAAEEALRQRADEQERFLRLSVGRELRMIELKREVNAMARRAGSAPAYPLTDDETRVAAERAVHE